jgi:hypothetical protein
MTEPKKDIIYIDIDDEITSIIEKVRSSPQKIVALVLPKRAAVFQSIVNMKLLKRSADNEKKKIVLITSEAGLMPMAGAVGLHVAKTLQSKPVLPAPPQALNDDAALPLSVQGEDTVSPLDASKPVGELAGLKDDKDDEETIEVEDEASAGKTTSVNKKGKKAKNKLKIPNFNKFRVRLLLAGLLLILLLAGWFAAARVLPTAEVIIKTDTQSVNANVKFISSPGVTELDPETATVPAITKQLKKNEGQRTPATGQKNTGEKAKGEVSLKNCSNSVQAITIPAGTSVNASSLTFLTAESVTLPASSFNGQQQCTTAEKEVDVVAQNSGAAYNLGARDYTVAGHAGVRAKGSDMSGGTDSFVKVVSQQDIDSLTQRITEAFTANAKEELAQQFRAEGLIPLIDTFNVGQPVTVSSPNVNDEANEVTANITMDFSMQGVKETDLKTLIEKAVSTEIDSERQTILQHGLDKAVFQINERQDNGTVSYSLQTIVIAGTEINEDNLKKEIGGKKSGEAENLIRRYPGVKEVSVNLEPFWVVKTPKNPGKISVTIETTNQDQNADE